MTAIGFVGLGTMGAPMARRLLEAGHRVEVFDLDPIRIDELVDHGAAAGESAAAVADRAEILCTSLPEPSHVEAVMDGAGALDAMSTGSVWVDLTTNRVELVQELARRRPDVGVVDSPVTGAVDGARTGRLTLFAGGTDDALDRVEPLLANLGRVIRCGSLGTGNVTKLVTNQLWFIHAVSLAEGFALGVANGVELDVLWEAIKDSVADSFVARHDAPSIFAGHYDPSFTLALCLKDLGLIDELAGALRAGALTMTKAAGERFRAAADRYGTDVGELHVARQIEDDNQLSFRLDGEWVPHWEVNR